MFDSLQVDDKVYESKFNDHAATYKATFHGKPVFVKRRLDPMDREAAVLRVIDDARIPKVIAYGTDAGMYQLVLQAVPGITMADYLEVQPDLRSRTIDDRESRAIICELAHGLIALRDAGYYYRDMNMKHILIANDGGDPHVSLIDHEADVAIGANGRAHVETRMGTWETMSPEEFDVGNEMTEASSVYALGAVLYQLTHGEAAFRVAVDPPEGKTSRDLSHDYHSAPIPSGRLLYMKETLGRALDPDPSKRYQTIEEFMGSLSGAGTVYD